MTAKGLRLGDEVLSIDGRQPSREYLWKLAYFYYTLRPQAGMTVTVKKVDGTPEVLTVLASVREGKRVEDLTGEGLWALIRENESEARLHRHRYHEDIDDVFLWKMPQFDLDDREVDRTMTRMRYGQGCLVWGKHYRCGCHHV